MSAAWQARRHWSSTASLDALTSRIRSATWFGAVVMIDLLWLPRASALYIQSGTVLWQLP